MERSQLKLYAYKNCSTCQTAKKWLKDHEIAFEEHDIYEYPPTTKQFYHWIDEHALPVKKFFNTSGEKYRELNMKDRVKYMTEDEQVALLASHGKLVKRPILTDGNLVLIGFDEVQWSKLLLNP